jgi:hypothetical protein
MAGRRGLLALSSRRDRVAREKLAAGDCWRYRPSVTAWPGERKPGNSETAGTPEALRRGRAATGNAAREPANESRKAAARGLLAGSYRGRRQRTPKLQGRRGMAGRRGLLALSSRRCARGPGGRQPGNSETTRTPGSYRPGDCWRYRPGVTAWPGGTPPENAKAARPPGGWPPEAPETARTPGRPGDGHRKRQRLPENRRTKAVKRCAVARGTPAGSQRRRRQRTPKLPPGGKLAGSYRRTKAGEL